ncbi:hypothetical protein EDB85DRAFT_265755 [Lactarius pseudohatsudake]|nr:hypothetical protein EDB85DRAFT_349191 [Lactarius pseudohatsudake]KAH9039655.1 hypothetical protein EDB85DRAFT_265755 [Lactarius pseudohatsudake]
MLDFEPSTPAYPTHVQDNDSFFRLQQMQADPLAYSPYSPPYSPAVGGFTLKPPLTPLVPAFAIHPGPQSFNFDPFADEDSSTSSGASERERELEVQRLRRIEFLRRREWMRRVVAWVDGISHGMTPTLSPSPTSSSKRGNEPGGKDIPMAAQSRLLKFEFFSSFCSLSPSTSSGCGCGCLLSIYFWLRPTGVDAWPPVNHSYHIHHLRIHSHPSILAPRYIFKCNISGSRLLVVFSLSFSFPLSVQRLSIF